MFAEDLQGDIYDGGPGVSILLSSPSYFHTDEPPQKRTLRPRGSAAAIMGWDTGFPHPASFKRRKWNIYVATRSIRGAFNEKKIKKPTEI